MGYCADTDGDYGMARLLVMYSKPADAPMKSTPVPSRRRRAHRPIREGQATAADLANFAQAGAQMQMFDSREV